MSRKIKIQTVDETNLTNLENTLNENLCKKHVTISGPDGYVYEMTREESAALRSKFLTLEFVFF